MAYISYKKLRESEFDNIVFKKDKVQDIQFTQLKLKVHERYEKVEKKTTNIKAFNPEDVMNKVYLEKKY